MTTPQFPTYTGNDIPSVLQPWNPWHYWLLLKWVYFQPSKLRSYLYCATPDLYQETGWHKFLSASRILAIRQLFVMMPILAIILSAFLVQVVSVLQNTMPDWGRYWLGVVISVVISMVSGRLGLYVGNAIAISVTSVILVSVVSGLALGAADGRLSDPLAILAVGIAFRSIFGMLISVVHGGLFLGGTLLFAGLLYGRIGLAMILFLWCLPFYLMDFILYCIYKTRQIQPLSLLVCHPALWDEFSFLPFPSFDILLTNCLKVDRFQVIPHLCRIMANPYQHWAVQKALVHWIEQDESPLSCLYYLLHNENANSHFTLPYDPGFLCWRKITFREFILAEICGLSMFGQERDSVDNSLVEICQWVWRFTYILRTKTSTPLIRVSTFLYWLLQHTTELNRIPIEELVEVLERDNVQADYHTVSIWTNGQEIISTFCLITQSMQATNGDEIVDMQSAWNELNDIPKPWLRPYVMATLQALADVSLELVHGWHATSRSAKAGALIRANGTLQELAEYVEKQVLPPEQVLLAWLVEHWQEIIAKEQGKLGAEALQAMSPQMRREAGIGERQSAVWQRPVKPFDNPYIAGDPVYPPLLVGRTDIFNRIGEIWGAKENPDSIILYGHRRMGKSSILRNLAQAAPEKTIIAYADMQGETSFVASTEDFLLGLADRLYYAVEQTYLGALSQPHPDDYNSPARASRSFHVLTDNIRPLLDGQSLILALDEFEAVEKAVVAGKIGPEIYQFLRSKSMEPGLTLVFGGLHTLDEMSRDYAQPFYGSYTNIKVSYLPHQEAWRLITNPNEDFPLNYEPEAVERIITETGGQPYLVQLVCREALDHLNHSLFDLQQERDVLLTLADVEAVLDGGLFQRGMVYFDGVWSQATEENQRHLLRTLAGRAEPWAWNDMQQASGLTSTELKAALNWTERQDVMQKVGDPPVWQFYVPLMRQWIRTTKGIK